MPEPALTQELLALSFAFMMVLCRCGAAVMLLPGFGEEGPPVTVRAGIAIGLAVLLVPSIAPQLPPPPDNFVRLVALLVGELLAGGFLGWLARVVALALPAAGQIVSLATGLSSVLQPDADFGASTSSLGKLFAMMMPVLILASGLYALPLTALAGSYAALPAGAPPPGADLTEMAVRAVSAHFALALRLAAPFLLIGTMWQVALGLISRLVPQIQIYFAALPGQVLGGLLLLAVLSGGVATVWLRAVGDAFQVLP
ncbi:MAG TPA: flagellar biosynthetic protein FliR [Acetobacteraceae bacterium]|nr:flagellar biosynthetic protein FliR [Acetobacteraceae bacterium]